MKKILIPIILSVLVAVSSCGPKRYLTTSRAPGVGLDTINYGAYNNDPSADKARPAFMKANGPIREYNRLQLYNLEPTELAILRGAAITTSELNRLAGVTSAIQTQINGRLRSVDSTGNAAGNYVTRKALLDTLSTRVKVDSVVNGAGGYSVYKDGTAQPPNIPSEFTEELTTEELTSAVLIHVGDTTVTAIIGRIVFKTSDSNFYGCRYLSGKKWHQLNN